MHLPPRAYHLMMLLFFIWVSDALAQDQETTRIESVAGVYAKLQNGNLSADAASSIERFFQTRMSGENLSIAEHRHLIERTADGGGYVAWCFESPADKPVRIMAEKDRSWNMIRIGNSNLWVWAEKFNNFQSVHYRYEVDGKRIGGGRENRFGFESYEWLPDSLEQAGVPKGKLIDMGKHVSQKHFVGAERQWWVYVPAQYPAAVNASGKVKLIVFNDGAGFAQGEGNACTVLDNLIHHKKIPVMIAVFINPGDFPGNGRRQPASNRSNEYDTCTPRYANFLDEEILPIVREQYAISEDPWDHAICGSSSGASCAFTAAWHRNDLFRRVISFVGSFCDFRPIDAYPVYGQSHVISGDEFAPWKTAHDYPALIRKMDPPKAIKVFLQDGENDLDNQLGNWFKNNERMAAALAYGGYDFQFVRGEGMHSKKHGMSILPEILVWLWQDPQ